MKDCLTGDGVRGDSLTMRPSWGPLRGVLNVGVLAIEFGKGRRSESELRRFLRGGPVGVVLSPIVASGEFSKAKAPNTVGRSRETGRFGERRLIASVELAR
jgi:hypothetical protein